MHKLRKLLVLSFLSFVISCSNDKEDSNSEEQPVIENISGTLGEITYFDRDKVSEDYILVNDAQSNRVYLMDHGAEPIHEWPLQEKRLGNDIFLMKNGKILAMLESEDPQIKLGGFGGVLRILDKTGNVEWDFEYSSNDYILHHDAETLPNGNIIVQVWNRKTEEEAIMAGSKLQSELFPDSIIEVDPTTNDIVWKWNSWDHLVQDFDETKDNFGSVADNPRLINLNYVNSDDGDITHANGLAYDPDKDLIYLSVNFFSEVWVIDHSTSTAEASSHEGGTYGYGGDLVYRFGNPRAYNNLMGKVLFDHNHHPNLLAEKGYKEMLIFSNGFTSEKSTVYQLNLPTQFGLEPGQDNEPEVLWSFTDENLFSPKVSGATRLSNGNTLITEGDFGIWEVTEQGMIVWQFEQKGFFWRSYPYLASSEAIINLGI